MVYTEKNIQFEVKNQGCHVIISHKPQADGYIHIGRKGFYGRLHRLVYEKRYGKIPQNKNSKERFIVCHSCDEPKCINIDHLFLGTDKVNNKDRALKNRSYAEKLTPQKVAEIKWLLKYDDFLEKQEIARLFNVSPSCVSYIISGRIWKHVEVADW